METKQNSGRILPISVQKYKQKYTLSIPSGYRKQNYCNTECVSNIMEKRGRPDGGGGDVCVCDWADGLNHPGRFQRGCSDAMFEGREDEYE